MQDINKIITEILAIVDYNGDKEKFIDDLLHTGQSEAFFKLLKEMPSDKQKLFEEKLKQCVSEEAREQVIKDFFPQEQYQKEYTRSIADTLKETLNSASSNLSEQQKSQLTSYFNNLSGK